MAQFYFVLGKNAERARSEVDVFGMRVVYALPHATIKQIPAGVIGVRATTAAPQEFYRAENGDFCWLVGQADGLQGPDVGKQILEWAYAGTLLRLAEHTGFFLAVIGMGDRVFILADLLGLFPVYFHEDRDTVRIASSPEIILFGGKVEASLNIRGVIGHLLTLHEVDNQSIWQNIRRLPPGFLLEIHAGGLSISRLGRLPVSDSCFGSPPEQLLGMIDEALTETFSPYAGHNWEILMSGGLDSRIVAAALRRARPKQVQTVTLGLATDFEARCARRCVEHLGWNGKLVEIPADAVLDNAVRQIHDEHLACGLNDASWWQLASLPFQGEGLLTGILGDAAMGGSHVNWAWNTTTKDFNFPAMAKRVYEWGIGPERLKSLLKPKWRAVVDEVIENMRRTFEGFEGWAFQKAWAFDLAHRQRYHVGGPLHRIAYAIWPSLPLASRNILAVAGGLPCSNLMFREMQKKWLIRFAPDLAALPLDTNSYYPHALLETPITKIKNRIAQPLAERLSKRLGHEHRYYYRAFNINSPGYQALRKMVPNSVPQLEEYFDYRSLLDFIDDRSRPEQMANPIRDSSGIKTLIGLAILLRKVCITRSEDRIL
mgnify:CR=1 FL=1